MLKVNDVNYKKALIDSMLGMSIGFFATLIISTIIELFAKIPGLSILNESVGPIKTITGFGIGIGVGYKLNLNIFQIFAVAIASQITSISTFSPSYINGSLNWKPIVGFKTKFGSIGDVFSAWIISYIVSIMFLKYSFKTALDIILIPLIGFVMGLIGAFTIIVVTGTIIVSLEWIIEKTMNTSNRASQIFLAPVIGVLMGLALTMPISSVAIAIALSLHGQAANAAMAGTAAQMMSFGVLTFISTKSIPKSLAVGFGTSMLHLSNIARNPKMILIPIIVSALAALFATIAIDNILPKHPSPTAGMGTCLLYGPIFTIDDTGWTSLMAWLHATLFQILIPIILTLILFFSLNRINFIRKSDYVLTV